MRELDSLVPPARAADGPADGGAAGPPASLIRRTLAHVNTPLYRNAYALILSTGLTSGLGFIYWLVAARLYPAEVVGVNSAALSSMTFLAGVAQFSLASVLIRFIPGAGPAAQRLADRATLVTIVAGAVAGVLFVAGIDWWAPSLGFLRENPLLGACFALSAVAWGVFLLQEGVMTGLRRAPWIPARNAVFAAGKIVLLFVFAAILPQYGIFASWIVPAAAVLLPMGLLIRGWLGAWAREATAADARPLVVPHIVQYAAADYVGSLLSLAAIALVPVMVIEMAGAEASAHFYLAWTIAYTLYLVPQGMGSSLVVESVIDPAKSSANSWRALRQAARLVIPLVLVLVAGAPYILALLGKGYAAEGTVLLRVLALSALPNILTTVYLSILRAQRRVRAVVAILALQCALVLALSYLLLQMSGIAGVGYAWLISQIVVAGTVIAMEKRIAREAIRLGGLPR